MYLLWLSTTAACMFAAIVAPDVARYFDLDLLAFDLARYLRRKWRQHVSRWRKVWATNWEWSNRNG